MSRTTTTVEFQALELKGGLLPGSLLEEVAKLQRPKDLQLQAADYGLPSGERLRDHIDAAWVQTKVVWEEFRDLGGRASAAGLHFGLRMLQEVLNWSDIQPIPGWQHNEAHYPITHRAFAGAVPLIIKGMSAEALDKGSKQFGQNDRRRSPHSCLQNCLNADDSANWGVLIGSDRLRLLHDNPSLVKPAYLAADLELLIEGERFDEFSVLWLLLHASRFQHPQTGSCVLDQWKQKAEKSGERVLGKLRGGVQSALESLGNGLLNHPDNGTLRDALFQNRRLSTEQFHGQLLRLVYRFLFLFTVEDRNLLFPRTVEPSDPRRQIYRIGYSLHRLRELAIKRSAYEDNYDDLWQVQRLVFQQLSISNSPLGLPGLGGLFSMEQCTNLQECELCNSALLRAVKAIGWFDASGTFTRVRYRDLNTEELGSVYEGLLELHPQIEREGTSWLLSYGGSASNARKTTGSYYTPDLLVQELVKSTLVPVIENRLGKANTIAEKEAALLAIKVIDPACGSGHFLLAAARRLAVTLAQIRAGDDQPSEDNRQHALRDVVGHCIYAVDKNPMAVELCKVALWIEAISPGKPLSFLDAHIQCGDSLVGVFDPKVLDGGIPDEFYKPLTGDEKKVCSSLKKENAIYRRTNRRGGDLQVSLDLSKMQARRQQQLQAIEAIPGTSLSENADKEAAYAQWQLESSQDPEILAADLFTAAFFLTKTSETRFTVPTTEHLLMLLDGQKIAKPIEQAVAQAAEKFHFFHWYLRFGNVMAQGGFDCVIGNPPFGGSVGSFGDLASITNERAMNFLASQFICAKNAFDLSLIFFEISVRALRNEGWYGMFTPLGPWSSQGGKAWRSYLEENAPPSFFLLASEGNWFSGASVRTGALSGANCKGSKAFIHITKTRNDYTLTREQRPRQVSCDSYFEAVSGDSVAQILRSSCSTFVLEEQFEILADCSTSAAYDLVPFIYDEILPKGRKLINTKLIDRFRPRWGKVAAKYLKADYSNPAWPEIDEPNLPTSLQRALRRQMRPKILIAGLTKVLEAFGDYEDEYAGVVSTWIIVHPDNNKNLLRRINACLNSWYASYQYWRMQGSQTIVGGMTIKKAALKRLPIPFSILQFHQNQTIDLENILGSPVDLNKEFDLKTGLNSIEVLCDEIEKLARMGNPFLYLEQVLNKLICWSYGLSDLDYRYLQEWHSSRDLKNAER